MSAGDKPGYADFLVWVLMEAGKLLVSDPYKEQPTLNEWDSRMSDVPAIKAYVKYPPRDISQWL